MTRTRLFALSLIVAALAGCMTVGPDYKRPQIETPGNCLARQQMSHGFRLGGRPTTTRYWTK